MNEYWKALYHLYLQKRMKEEKKKKMCQSLIELNIVLKRSVVLLELVQNYYCKKHCFEMGALILDAIIPPNITSSIICTSWLIDISKYEMQPIFCAISSPCSN